MPGRVDELRSSYGLQERQRDQLAALLALIEQDDRAPTTVRDPALAVELHLAHYIETLDLVQVRDAKSIPDVEAE
jgi:hypothetical protein